MQSYNPGVLRWGFLKLSTLALTIGEYEHRRPMLMSREDERLILGHVSIYWWKRHAFCCAVWGYASNLWRDTLSEIFCNMATCKAKYSEMWTFYILVCPLRFLVISAMRRLGNVESFKTYVFRFRAFFSKKATPAKRVTPPWHVYMANCHRGWQGYPTWQTGEPAQVGHPTYHVNVIKIK